MPRFLTDENFDHNIVRGVFARDPAIDLFTVQAVGLMQTPDPDILQWAANAGRILLTHDVQTIPNYAYERIRNGQPMPGVIVVLRSTPYRDAIDDLLVAAGAGRDEDFEDQVRYIPLNP
jgi:predicted nuclease of predicted toxin-antitoxin system